MVGEEHDDLVGVMFEFGELAHPLQVRRPLGVEIPLTIERIL